MEVADFSWQYKVSPMAEPDILLPATEKLIPAIPAGFAYKPPESRYPVCGTAFP
jgi:hypothetical protein